MGDKNLFEIWKYIGKVTPFPARRQGWSDCYHVIVEKVTVKKWPYGDAFGYPCEDGKPNDHFQYSEDWRESGLIPSAGTYQWELALDTNPENINEIKTSIENERQKAIKSAKVLTKGNKIGFGKHKGKTIEELIAQEANYISWAIQNIDSFIVDPLLLNSDDKITIPENIVILNERKLDIQ